MLPIGPDWIRNEESENTEFQEVAEVSLRGENVAVYLEATRSPSNKNHTKHVEKYPVDSEAQTPFCVWVE